MRIRKSIVASLSLLTVYALGHTACVQAPTTGGGTELPEAKEVPVIPPGGEPSDRPAPPLTASLTTDRPLLIRDDVVQGSAKLTATSSQPATFRWCHTDEAGLLEIEGTPDIRSSDEGRFTCLKPVATDEPTKSTLEIKRVKKDPGPNGKRITFRVEVTEARETAQTRPLVREFTIEVVRAAETLTAIMERTAGNVPPGRTITFRARISGGRPFALAQDTTCVAADEVSVSPDSTLKLLPPNNGQPFNVSWEVTEDDGLRAGDSTVTPRCLVDDDGVTVSELTYQAPQKRGTVSVKVTVTDASGVSNTDSTSIVVSSSGALTPLQVGQAIAATPTIAPGDRAELSVEPTGGEPPFTITFAVDSNRRGGSLSGAGCPPIATGDCTVDYIAALNRTGTDIVDVTITDAVGDVVRGTITVTVAALLGLDVTLVSDAAGAQPNTPISVQSDMIGGVPPYKVCYNVTNAAGSPFGTLSTGESSCRPIEVGELTFENCSCDLGDGLSQGLDLVNNTRTYTAPGVEGNANIRVAVTDAVGKLATALLTIPVSSSQISGGGGGGGTGGGTVSLSAVALDSVICLATFTTINASASGGVTPYTFAYSIVGGALSGEGESVAPLSDSPGGTTSSTTYTAPTSTTGTRTVRVQVTEPGGSSDVVNVSILIPGNPAANAGPDLPGRCDDGAVPTVGGSPTGTGGTAPYTFAWTGSGATFLNSTTPANPQFDVSAAGAGTYEVCVGVSDTEGCASAIDCATITVISSTCGDSVTECNEVCDEGALNGSGNGRCLSDCSGVQGCGNGVINGTEVCDDGVLNGTGPGQCNLTCTRVQTCGDTFTDGTETCDDGDTINNGEAGCLGDCSGIQTCGDGAPQGTEACDDGDTVSNGQGFCLADCSGVQICGDGTPAGTEACDDGDTISSGEGDCLADCSGIQTCGDGATEGTEACDDGDTISNGPGSCLGDCSGVQGCGNGVVEGTEVCDDGVLNGSGTGLCNLTCTRVQTCGDSFLDGTEACDDGDTINNGEAGCLADCSGVQTCGDGARQGTETCDDGDTISNGPGACLADCSGLQTCGNGVPEGTEACDDGDTISSGEADCLADCSGIQTCGDGATEGTEFCDEGALNGTGNGRCLADCSAVQGCGNGLTEGTEACDDGGLNGTGEGNCLADCSGIQTCGDGTLNGTEACDDGDTISNGPGACLSDCSGLQTCGDGATEGTEVCDDGDSISNGNGFCIADCTAVQVCGNSIINGTESCDDGDTVSSGEGDCLADCSGTQTCGDGATEGTEACDDGDTVSNGNGSCIADCTATQTCGNAITNGTEGCDDGNTISEGESFCAGDCSGVQTCGDSTTNGTEACDDGDTIDNGEGGCLADCSGIQTCGDSATEGTEGCDDGNTVSEGEGFCAGDCSGVQICGDSTTNGTEACDDGDTIDNGEGGCLADCSGVQTCGDGAVEGTEECDGGADCTSCACDAGFVADAPPALGCVPLGACCDGTTCTEETAVSCTFTYKGDGTSCTPNPCP